MALRAPAGAQGCGRDAGRNKRHDRAKPLKQLAGAGGFEPPHGGIKIRCLTTWLHPITGHTIAGRVAGRSGAAHLMRFIFPGQWRCQRICGGQMPPPNRRRDLSARPWSCIQKHLLYGGCGAIVEVWRVALARQRAHRYKAASLDRQPIPGDTSLRPYLSGCWSVRSVAQPGSALASGARGRRFESSRSDQFISRLAGTGASKTASTPWTAPTSRPR